MFPPGSESAGGSPAVSAGHGHRRANLSLDLSLPNHNQFSQGISPASLGSSSAPFSDSMSLNMSQTDDYFRMSQAAGAPPLQGTPGETASAANPANFAYRLPASQPTSPIRGGVPFQGQAAFQLPGRQRSTTVSGGILPFDPSFNPNAVVSSNSGTPVSGVVPSHLTFTAISQTGTPSASTSPSADLNQPQTTVALGLAPAQTGTILPMDVQMDDMAQMSHSRRSSASQTGPGSAARAVAPVNGDGSGVPSANDLAERLTMERLSMLDK